MSKRLHPAEKVARAAALIVDGLGPDESDRAREVRAMCAKRLSQLSLLAEPAA